MDNSFVRPNRSDPNPISSTPSSPQTPLTNQAHEQHSDLQPRTHIPHTSTAPNPPVLPSHSVHQVSQLPPHFPTFTPTSAPAQSSGVLRPSVFFVPPNTRQILNFSPDSATPESMAKRALLSDSPNGNAIALFGMGGAGKTTILRALGRNADVWAKFQDGVVFIELGHDATVQKLLEQLEEIVAEAFPDFLFNFTRLAAKPNLHLNLMGKLIDRLATKRFLLIFDDVWDLDSNVYKLIDLVCIGVQEMEGGCCKVLTSTRNEEIGRVPTHDVSIGVNPEDKQKETCVEILCSYANIDSHRVSSFSSHNRHAFDSIVEMCGGLPLALSVAGSAIQDVLGPCRGVSESNGIVEYWERLKRNKSQLSNAEKVGHHKGLKAAVESSLASLEARWKGTGITMGEMFRSFCIMEKQMSLPLSVIEKVWGVGDGLSGVRILSRHSMLWVVEDRGGSPIGVRLHDLVHDLCLEMAEENEGVRVWHQRVIDGYKAWMRASESGGDHDTVKMDEPVGNREHEWWKLGSNEKYMNDNLVRHLLGAWCVSEALRLLSDYRWVERINEKERPPFQKIIFELQLLRKYLEKHRKMETSREVIRDLDVLLRAMGVCMVPYCMNNREECTFQVYGRLRDVVSKSGIVERLVHSIEQYGRRPWARAGPGVLKSGGSSLQRVLELDCSGECISVGARGEEVVVGGREGKVWVLNGLDGSKRRSLVGHGEDELIVHVYVDRSSGLIYSCSSEGRVIIWSKHKKWRSFQAKALEENERITCMQVLPTLQKIVLGTDTGRLMVIDINSGNITRNVNAHGTGVRSFAYGKNEDIVVSGAEDGTIRVWDTARFEDTGIVLAGHSYWVLSMVLSSDGRLLASGSNDRNIRLWDVRSGEQVWSSNEHQIFVMCVLFNSDGSLLYSVDCDGTICVWQVRNGGHNVTLLQTLRHATMRFVVMFCIGDHSELFVLNGNKVHGTRVHVWDGRNVDNNNPIDTLLPAVYNFALSEDETTMLTWNDWWKRLEVRNVCDVDQRIDRIISSFSMFYPQFQFPHRLAVSNDRCFVAYSDNGSCDIHVVDIRNGDVLHTLSDLEEWASSITLKERDISSSASSSRRSNNKRSIESLFFNIDGNIVSAVAAADVIGETSTIKKKSLSWNVLSGEPLYESNPDDENIEADKTTKARSVSKPRSPILSVDSSGNVTYQYGSTSFTIATMEDDVTWAQYCSHSSRLWLVSIGRGMKYVDLITDSTQLAPRDEPPLLTLQSHSSAAQDPATSTASSDTDSEVYDVFISHAGTDKFTIAKPLYDLLVALGFKVFLDKWELKAGQNAPEKMYKAMRTAKIAVIILSPEFVARKWTLRELMCFLERFREGGELGVIIIPVFYRLTLADCKDENSIFSLTNENGESVFLKEGFLKWMAQQQEFNIREVLKSMQSLRGLTGIENSDGVTNGSSAEEKESQREFVKSIADAIVDAKERLENGKAAGPSG